MSYMHVVNENIERVTKGKYKSYDEYNASMQKRKIILNLLSLLIGVSVMLSLMFNYAPYFDEIVYGFVLSIVVGVGSAMLLLTIAHEWSENMDKSIIHQDCKIDEDELREIYKTIEYYIGKVPYKYTLTIEEMNELNAYYVRLTNLRDLGVPSIFIKK